MSYIGNVELEEDLLNFEIKNLPPALLNSLRRTIINNIETLAFRTEYGKESDIKIEKNTSSLHNEFLCQRIGLIPIHYTSKDITSFERKNYEFFIDETNNSTKSMDITTEHIQIRDLTKEPPVLLGKKETQKFFPPNKLTGDYILINRLKPNKFGGSNEGECLKVKMIADFSTGKEHARYIPTCVSIFTNIRDPEKVKNEIQKRINKKNEELKSNKKNELNEPEKKDLIQSFMASEADRYFYTDNSGEPNKFKFTIESDGRIEPHKIFYKALFKLEICIKEYLKKIDDPEYISIENSDCIMHSFDILLNDEDYTLGYLIQEYLYRLYQNVEKENKKIKYIAANVPHPLENKLLIRISLENLSLGIDYIKDLMRESCNHIINVITELKKEFKNIDKFVLDR